MCCERTREALWLSVSAVTFGAACNQWGSCADLFIGCCVTPWQPVAPVKVREAVPDAS